MYTSAENSSGTPLKFKNNFVDEMCQSVKYKSQFSSKIYYEIKTKQNN